VSGLAACAAWADGLEVDADYPKDDPAVMATRLMVHGDQCCMLEDRRSAAGFLRTVAGEAPEARADLLAAADLYTRAAGAQVWPWGHEMGPTAQAGLADPAQRRAIVAEIRKACAAEEAAVELLEQAVTCMERRRR